MSKFRFQAVVGFQIEESTAAHLLADPEPARAVNDYLTREHGADDENLSSYISDHARKELHEAFGKHLADRKIAEQKQLPVSTGGES